MREILFKAKRLDNGEWVEGYYVYEPKITAEDAVNVIVREKHLILQQENEGGCTIQGEDTGNILIEYKVDPNTLSQYTGLKDKNGKMIFENDILKFDDESFVGLCVYKEEIAQFMFGDYDKDKDWFDFQAQMAEQSIIIIGNIFDNKELMEEE